MHNRPTQQTNNDTEPRKLPIDVWYYQEFVSLPPQFLLNNFSNPISTDQCHFLLTNCIRATSDEMPDLQAGTQTNCGSEDVSFTFKGFAKCILSFNDLSCLKHSSAQGWHVRASNTRRPVFIMSTLHGVICV